MNTENENGLTPYAGWPVSVPTTEPQVALPAGWTRSASDRRRIVRSDGAFVAEGLRRSDSYQSNPRNPRSRLWVAFDRHGACLLKSSGVTRKWHTAAAAMASLDREQPQT